MPIKKSSWLDYMQVLPLYIFWNVEEIRASFLVDIIKERHCLTFIPYACIIVGIASAFTDKNVADVYVFTLVVIVSVCKYVSCYCVIVNVCLYMFKVVTCKIITKCWLL